MKRHVAYIRIGLATCLAVSLASTIEAQSTTEQAFSNLRFREIGPATMSGRIVDLAVVESNPYTFYVASATGGVWKTGNNGITFTPVFHREATHSVGDVTVHQLDTSVVWVGTGERASRQSSSWGNGAYKSTDGGATWTNMGLEDSHHIGRIVLHPTHPDIVFVAAMGHLWGPSEERGLYMSEDGGTSWTRVLHVDENTGAVDVAIDPLDPTTMYAAMYQRRRRPYGFNGGGPGSGLYKSTDGGRNWRELTNDLPQGDKGRIGISIYRSDPNIVYISVEQGYRYNASTAYGERRAGVYRSEDKGETWEFMSDWNPRPMYASQPLVDPNDDQRIYMVNTYSYSDDGGKTFRPARQSLHGDDRLVWVSAHDSRHVMKADDGGLGISYDRGVTWLYVTNLPVSQFYRVTVDMREPYWVYGGLQDNGSWMGPSTTFRAEGILFQDWIKTGGGDGFLNLVDTTDNRTLYTESQYLGLSRVDLASGARAWIRPDAPRGAIGARRNWDAWGPGTPEPELGNAMAPANWDGPFYISPHDNNTIYAGTNQAWKSTDRGDTWVSLGDLTTGVNRRELPLMGERAHDTTLSLDDGIPYYPTLTAIVESPVRQGLLYAGTDDGNLQVSLDDGATWNNVTDAVPGLPSSSWISGIEPSRFVEGRVYVAVNNYRNDDFANYLFQSNDNGNTWTSITGDLPADRVLRTVREDPRNAQVVYLGTELGLFYTNDGGDHWIELKSNMPTLAFNDLVVHPRDNDLVVGTHGRGIWILDNINSLQETTPAVLASDAHLFGIEPIRMIRYGGERGHTGDMIFRGQNQPPGAIIDYYLREKNEDDNVTVTVFDAAGDQVSRLRSQTSGGVNRILWNLRYENLGPPMPVSGMNRGPSGPWVLPGVYTVRLTTGESSQEQTVTVLQDPRVAVAESELLGWHEQVQYVAGLLRRHLVTVDTVSKIAERIEGMPEDSASQYTAVSEEIAAIRPLLTELRNRLSRLYGQVSNWPREFTADERSQLQYFEDWLQRLQPRVDGVIGGMF
jgi:photosystem II stability/assembly factor-like uncharacterized protein